jgi:NADH:ubiquinone oxidoreductase subunit 6 (subunit J)
MVLDHYIFIICASTILASTFMVIRAVNSIHSVLFLILVFCNMAGLFLGLDLDFFSMTFLVVYVGAIAVLFLFVVMMLNIRSSESRSNALPYLPLGGFIAFIFIAEIINILDVDFIALFGSTPNNIEEKSFTAWANFYSPQSSISSIAQSLYISYALWFIEASLILVR